MRHSALTKVNPPAALKLKEQPIEEWTMFKSVQECSRVFKSVQECSRVFKSVQECSRVFKSVQECSRVFKSVQECSRVCTSWNKPVRKTWHVPYT